MMARYVRPEGHTGNTWLQQCGMTSGTHVTDAYAFGGGAWGMWDFWEKPLGGEAQAVTDYVFRGLCVHRGQRTSS